MNFILKIKYTYFTAWKSLDGRIQLYFFSTCYLEQDSRVKVQESVVIIYSYPCMLSLIFTKLTIFFQFLSSSGAFMDTISVCFSDLSLASCNPWIPKDFLFSTLVSRLHWDCCRLMFPIARKVSECLSSLLPAAWMFPLDSEIVKTFSYPAEIFHFNENLKICQKLSTNPCVFISVKRPFLLQISRQGLRQILEDKLVTNLLWTNFSV